MSNARDKDWMEPDRGDESRNQKTVLTPSEEIAQMHYSTGNFSTALEYFHRALQTPELPAFPDKFRMLLSISDCHRRKGSNSDAAQFLTAARATIPRPIDEVTLGKLEYREAYIQLYRGQYDAALKTGFSAYRRLKDTTEHAEVASIQAMIGQCYLRLGLLNEAEEFFSDSLSSYRRIEDQIGVAYAYNALGVLHKTACRWNRALASFNKSSDIAKAVGVTQQWISVQLNLGVVYGKLRRFPESISALISARDGAERFGDHVKLTKALLTLGRVYVQTRELAKAERNLVRAHSMAREMGFARESALADEFTGELMVARGSYHDAHVNFSSALKQAREFAPEGDVVAECLCRLANVELHLNRPEESLRLTVEGLEVAANCEVYELGFLHGVRARCHSRAGQLGDAIAEIEKSIGFFGQHELHYEKAMAQQYLVRLLRRTRREPELIKAKHVLSETIVELSKLDEVAGQIISQIMLATIDRRLGNVDDALLAVYEAERLIEEEQNFKFRPALQAIRNKVESNMSSAATRVLDQFSAFTEIQNGARSRDRLAEGLGSTLNLIIERLGAVSGFVAIPSPKGLGLEYIARTGLSLKEARAIAAWHADIGSDEGLINISLDQNKQANDIKSKLANDTGALLIHNLGFEGEKLGVLCVQHSTDPARGPLGQDALHFVTAYSSLISLSIYEVVRAEARGRQKPRPSSAKGFESIVTDNTDMIKLLNLAERVAHSDATVLLQGETGTGKGLIAYAVHLLSERREQKFIHVNCAALPEQLLESELFGHVRGAFTGAFADKPGLLQQASGGTIFLDEIGKTSLAMQGKLLQFLDSSRVRKVGSNDLVHVDVRVVCASKTNLLQKCEEGTFLEDFFYRINDFPLTVPPLRDRKEDIELLMDHYVEKAARDLDKPIDGVSEDFVSKLREYHWPGNVRELEKVIKRAVILADEGDMLNLDHLAPEVIRGPVHTPDLTEEILTLKERIEKLEHAAIAQALREHEGNKSRAAVQLGISYPNLLSKIKRYNIQ